MQITLKNMGPIAIKQFIGCCKRPPVPELPAQLKGMPEKVINGGDKEPLTQTPSCLGRLRPRESRLSIA